jgi:DNA-binding CsgD family transcriptional regulator
VAADGRPRRERSTGPESLTASELRVARMAADGLSNREIAQRLFVTRRTVEVHLTSTYRKLGIESRDELPTALGHGSPSGD